MYMRSRRHPLVAAAAFTVLTVLVGCTGMRQGEGGMDGDDEAFGTDTAVTRSDTAPGGMAGGETPDITAEMVQRGSQIFSGRQGGGTCFSCHGADGSGNVNGPDLTDDEWLNTDGTYQGIMQVVREGVGQPKEHPAPMPPMGGAQLSQEQVEAVSAYVYSLSHPDVAQ